MAPDSSPAIFVRGLSRTFGSLRALDRVGFAAPRGSVTLLAGPNGAGKTTLLRVLLDLVARDEGEVQILGMDPAQSPDAVRARIGYLPESPDFPFDHLRVSDLLAFHAEFRHDWDPAYAEELKNALELPGSRRWGQLSKGQRRRVQIAVALAHRPELLLLDEPTDGLDPVGRRRVLELLGRHLADTGATVLYCTHVLAEALPLADRLLVLRQGTVRVEGAIDDLRRTHLMVTAGPEESAGLRPDAVLHREPAAMGLERILLQGDAEVLRREAGVPADRIEPATPADIAMGHLEGSLAPVTGDPR